MERLGVSLEAHGLEEVDDLKSHVTPYHNMLVHIVDGYVVLVELQSLSDILLQGHQVSLSPLHEGKFEISTPLLPLVHREVVEVIPPNKVRQRKWGLGFRWYRGARGF